MAWRFMAANLGHVVQAHFGPNHTRNLYGFGQGGNF
jgi:hypothetical protein